MPARGKTAARVEYVAGPGTATAKAFYAARRLADDEFQNVKLPGGIQIHKGGVNFAPAKKQRLGGYGVPSFAGKSAGDEKNQLHEAYLEAENNAKDKMDLDELYRHHQVPGSNLCPSARGLYWEGIVAKADVLRRTLFLESSQLHLPPETRRHFFVEYIPIKEDCG